MEQAARIVAGAIGNDRKLLICGDGGCSADSQHIAVALVGKFNRVRKALSAEALTVNESSLSAIGDDFDLGMIFKRQVEAKGCKGDVLLGISASGASWNVLPALLAAREIGLRTILLTGGRGDRPDVDCDVTIAIPSTDTPRIQEAHIMVANYICEYVEQQVVGAD